MNAPQNTIWGPHLWLILHSTVERFAINNSKLPQEEIRIWKNLLSSLRYALPCPLCKKHYTEYYAANQIIYSRTNLRNWLYNLHTSVNNRIKKANIELDKIPKLYGQPFNFTQHYNIIVNEFNKALKIGICSRDDIQKCIRSLQEIKIFYDFF